MTQSEVATLMAEILETDEIGADESFFEVGGTSFLVLTLIARIRERTGATLRMIDIIRRPTPVGVHELVAVAADGVS
jgi:mycobactin peptide synthetase MbtE